ncbi:prepilin peptidase [Vibrio salinus]|uniref:prepilin peptidase n=1 Tax=Vibrio salinus TaxID=2899784 RepID=UPI001E539A86|nr:A24 family peptidase [Vibrio salinus]MCE0493379.1 A24 family peptidase [Vibrio salinus]
MLNTETINEYPTLFLILVTLFGIIIGSFLNVIIYRLPQMMHQNWLEDFAETFPEYPISVPDKKMNLSLPGSFCPICKTKIKPIHNVPILSWLYLKGHCAYCGTKISIRYPLVEALSGAISYLTYSHFGPSAYTIFCLIFAYLLISAAFIDADTKLLPDSITLPLLWLGLLLSLTGVSPVSLQDSVTGAIIGYLCLWSLYWLFKIFTGKEGMGYGDFKLLAALGVWCGWQALPIIVLLSSVSGSTLGIIQLWMNRHHKEQTTTFAFGPYLALAGWFCLLWKDDIMQWYIFHILG